MTAMLTELDLTIPEIAQIYYDKKWYPAVDDTVDIEPRIRVTLLDLLRVITEYPEKEEGVAGTMRLHIEKDPECNMATIYLNIGTVEW